MNYALTARLGTFLFFWITLLSLHADIKNPPTLDRAPVPQPQKVTVNRGEMVEIELNAVTSSNKEVIFIPRNLPAFGKFLDQEPVRRGKSSVILRYQSDPNAKGNLELIKFAVRVEGSAVSPAETLQINILDIKPALEFPEKIDAGKVRFGDTTSLSVFVRNAGNGEFNRAVLLPQGWSWAPESNPLVIPAGKTVEAKLNFSPPQLGVIESPVSFGTGEKAQTRLIGTGLPPVELPTVVPLEWDAAQGKRLATIPVKNPSSREVTISLKSSDPDLQIPAELKLAAFADGQISLALVAAPAKEFTGTVELSTYGMKQEIKVTALPAPANLKLVGLNEEGILDFGAIPTSKLSEATKSLKFVNSGGLPEAVFGHQPDSFVIEGYSKGMTIAPGAEVPLTVKISPKAIGKVLNIVEWTSGKIPLKFQIKATITNDEAPGETLTAPPSVTGAVVDPNEPSNPLEAPDRRTIDAEMNIGRAGLLSPLIKLDNSVTKVQGVYQKGFTDHTVTIAWKLHQNPAYEYVVLQRTIRVQKGSMQPRVVWNPVKEITYAKEGNEGTATMTGLNPGWMNAIRVSAKSPEGGYSQPTDPLHFYIPYPKPVNWTKYLLIVSAIALVVIWRWWQKRNAPLPRVYRPRIDGETPV